MNYAGSRPGESGIIGGCPDRGCISLLHGINGLKQLKQLSAGCGVMKEYGSRTIRPGRA